MSKSTQVFLRTFLLCAVAVGALTAIFGGIVRGDASIVITFGLLTGVCVMAIVMLGRSRTD